MEGLSLADLTKAYNSGFDFVGRKGEGQLFDTARAFFGWYHRDSWSKPFRMILGKVCHCPVGFCS